MWSLKKPSNNFLALIHTVERATDFRLLKMPIFIKFVQMCACSLFVVVVVVDVVDEKKKQTEILSEGS